MNKTANQIVTEAWNEDRLAYLPYTEENKSEYLINETINHEPISGGTIKGDGRGSGLNKWQPRRGPCTALVATDKLKDAVLKVRGTDQTFRDFAIWGSTGYQIETKGLVPRREYAAIEMDYSNHGLGTGGHRFRDLMLCGFETGFKFASEANHHNCDESFIDGCDAENLGSYLGLYGTQAVNHTITKASLVHVDNVIDVHRGGRVVAGHISSKAGKCIGVRLRGGHYSPTVHDYSIDYLGFDAQCEHRGELVRMDKPCMAEVRINGGSITCRDYHKYDARMATLRGEIINDQYHMVCNPRLVVEDFIGLQKGTLEWHSKPGSVCHFVLANCKIFTERVFDLLAMNSSGIAYIHTSNVTNLRGDLLPDLRGEVVGYGVNNA